MSVNRLAELVGVFWITFALFVGGYGYLGIALDVDSFVFERIVSFCFSVMLAGVAWLAKGRLRLSRSSVKDLALVSALGFWVLWQTKTSEYLAPIGFFFFLLAVYYFGLRFGFVLSGKAIRRIVVSVFAIAAGLLLSAASGSEILFQQDVRFVGFMASPTTFATWVIVLWVLIASSLRDSTAIKWIWFGWFMMAILVWLSGTRINIIAIVLLGCVFFYYRSFDRAVLRILVQIGVLLFVVFVYPIYGWVSDAVSSEIITLRYDGGEDASFGLRVVLYESIKEAIFSGEVSDILLGHGSEASREAIYAAIGYEILPHNDILRVIYDFGLMFFVGFVVLVVRLSLKNFYAFMLCVLYCFSFLHNMVYSHYLFALIIVFAFLRKFEKQGMIVRGA